MVFVVPTELYYATATLSWRQAVSYNGPSKAIFREIERVAVLQTP